MENEERITKLEIKIAFLEDTIEKLSDEIIIKGKLIDKIFMQIEKIKNQINDEAVKEIEKPPHY
ncbi:MAG: SlyX family protein [Spirochaetes bacterium]|nr:SlyX family protein [Spirochaetota bacterium]